MAKTTLRCYGKKSGDQYIVSCVDLCLAAQGDSFEEARNRLHSQIETYISEACNEDVDRYKLLMNRKSPPSILAEYYFIKTLFILNKVVRVIHVSIKNAKFSIFSESMQHNGSEC